MTEVITTPKPTDENSDGDKGGESKFSQEQVDSIITERLKKERENSEKTIADRIAEATAEAERKATLTAEEREKADRESRDASAVARETELNLRESRMNAKDILQSKGISGDLVEFVVDADMDKTKANIDKFDAVFIKAVETAVAEKLKGKAPEDFSNSNGDKNTKTSRTGQIAF